MATKLRLVQLVCSALLLASCSAPWSSNQATTVSHSTPVPSGVPVVSETSTVEVTPTSPAADTPEPSPTVVAATPTSTPTPTLVPQTTPIVHEGPVSECCGVFAWADSTQLLVFDTPSSGQQGTYLVNVQTGSRELLASVFGTTSKSGLIAFPNAATGLTEIRKLDGSLVSSIQNGGRVTWISPDGQHLAWLVDQGVPNTSSLVKRIVRLTTSIVDGSNVKALVEFEASSLQWLPDNLHVLTIARAQDGTHSGIWTVNATDGTNGVVVPGTYIQSLRVSPDGTRMAYLVTFSGDTSNDGVWVANVDGSNQIHLRETGAFRWAGDSNSLWFLGLSPQGSGEDHLTKVNVANDSTTATVGLGGRVLDGQWEVNPAGDVAAFWTETDQSVVVKRLVP